MEIKPERLLEVVAAVAKEARPHVEPHANLDSSLERELGLDSLARVELVLRLEKEFGASLPEQALATSETPRDLLRFLLSSAGQAPHVADTKVASLVQGEGVLAPSGTQARTLTEAMEYHLERQPRGAIERADLLRLLGAKPDQRNAGAGRALAQ